MKFLIMYFFWRSVTPCLLMVGVSYRYSH